jgi:hypothetical protein
MVAASGRDAEPPLLVAIKAFFWQWYLWRFLRSNLKTELALIVLPFAVFAIFGLSALLLGLFGQDILATSEQFLPFYLQTTLLFWVTVIGLSLAIWLATIAVRAIRRLVWWIRRG